MQISDHKFNDFFRKLSVEIVVNRLEFKQKVYRASEIGIDNGIVNKYATYNGQVKRGMGSGPPWKITSGSRFP